MPLVVVLQVWDGRRRQAVPAEQAQQAAAAARWWWRPEEMTADGANEDQHEPCWSHSHCTHPPSPFAHPHSLFTHTHTHSANYSQFAARRPAAASSTCLSRLLPPVASRTSPSIHTASPWPCRPGDRCTRGLPLASVRWPCWCVRTPSRATCSITTKGISFWQNGRGSARKGSVPLPPDLALAAVCCQQDWQPSSSLPRHRPNKKQAGSELWDGGARVLEGF